MKKQLILTFFLGCFLHAGAQLTLTEKPAAELIQNLAANETNAIISNVYFNGSPNCMREFSGYVYNMPFWEGILMTTGYASYALGPNDESGAGTDNGYIGYGPLNNTYGAETYNAAHFDFDIKPLGDTITLEYIFASEEFNTPTSGNDAFAILISGPGISGVKNIARLPNNQPVCRNSFFDLSYYINNGNGSGPPFNESNIYLEYNGISVPLTAKQAVTPNQTYHITLVVMDVSDAIFDTGVFIHYRSLTAGIAENELASNVSVTYDPLLEEASVEVKGNPDLNCSLIDLSGKIISEQSLSGSGKIDLRSLPSGIYLVHLEGSAGELTKRVIKY